MTKKTKQSNIDEEYKNLNPKQFVYFRPENMIGSVALSTERRLYYDHNSDTLKYNDESTYVKGILTLFNELINNSFDEYIRTHSEASTHKLNHIEVEIDVKNGGFKVRDNGGIPVKKHTKSNKMLPAMLFGELYSSKNYTQQRGKVSGLNGVGASLVNILSTDFTVVTSDGTKKFTQNWKGLDEKGKLRTDGHKIVNSKQRFTEVKTIMDFKPFECDVFTKGQVQSFVTRCMEIAAIGSHAKTPLKVTCSVINNGRTKPFTKTWKFKTYTEYLNQLPDAKNYVKYETPDYKFSIGCNDDGKLHSVAILNSIRCDNGTHVDRLLDVISSKVRPYLKKKYKIDISNHQFKSQVSIYSCWGIEAPTFDSQTKDKLTLNYRNFGFDVEVTDRFIKQLCDSPLIKKLVEEHKFRAELADRAALQKANKAIKTTGKRLNISKLVDASTKKNRHNCTLYITEGESASTGFRRVRNALEHGMFSLRGKFVNILKHDPKTIITKKSVRGEHSEMFLLMKSLGLQFGKPAAKFNTKTKKWELDENLRFGKICILTDADVDGSSIACLLMLMFHTYWKELIEAGAIYRILTPIVIVRSKNKVVKKFYSLNEYSEWESKQKTISKYTIEYTKGLGRLSNDVYDEIINDPVLQRITIEDSERSTMYLNGWFDNTTKMRDLRKLLVAGENEEFEKLYSKL